MNNNSSPHNRTSRLSESSRSYYPSSSGYTSSFYESKNFEYPFQVYTLNNPVQLNSQFRSVSPNPNLSFHPQFSPIPPTSPVGTSPNSTKIKLSAKFQKQLNDSTLTDSTSFPASREPDMICDTDHDNCLARTNHLALGMLRILDRYHQLDFSSELAPKPGSSLPTALLKIKYDLTTTLRNTIPLGHLQKIAKHHNLQSVLWYPCNFPNCYNIYQNRRSLRRHIFAHTGETPHSCKFPGCNKAYVSSDRLKEHIHSHTNRRPYRCNFVGCVKAYNESKTLREHKLTHGEKLFSCQAPGCSKSFHRKTHLKQHLQTHSQDLAI